MTCLVKIDKGRGWGRQADAGAVEEKRMQDRRREKLNVEKGESEGEKGLKPLAAEQKIEKVQSQV